MSLDSVDGLYTDSGYETLSPSFLKKEKCSKNTEILNSNEVIDFEHSTVSVETEVHVLSAPQYNESTNSDSIVDKFISDDIDVSKVPSKKNTVSKKFSSRKCKRISQAIEENDSEFLQNACLSPGGLISDDIRKIVWPKLLGVDIIETSPRPTMKQIEQHPYYQQVVLDVNRSLQRFPPSIAESQRLTMLDQLVFLIMRVLCKHPHLHYYQGYHDICVTFLLVLGEETSFYVLEKLSRTHLKVFMEESMEPTIHLLEHMYSLMEEKNLELKHFLLKSEVGVAYCLSWLITWFGHVLNDYDNVVRLFDLFIVSHSWMPLYLTTAIVMHRKEEVLKQDCDMASVHSLLSHIPNDLPFEELIIEAGELFKAYTPKHLAKQRPYVKSVWPKKRKNWWLLHSVSRTIKSTVGGTKITLPLVLAASVIIAAVLYQAYKY